MVKNVSLYVKDLLDIKHDSKIKVIICCLRKWINTSCL